jgi:excinuclease UvrABC ATPase subunit
MRARPKRPDDTFADFCEEHGKTAKNPYPCLNCRGRGWVKYDGAIDHDTVRADDGTILAEIDSPTKTIGHCPECHGTGQGIEEGLQKAFSEMLRRKLRVFEKETEKYDRLRKIRYHALKKLTKDEKKAIEELGI